MWQTKTFKTIEAMKQWLNKNKGRIEFVELAINNGFGIQYRKLRML